MYSWHGFNDNLEEHLGLVIIVYASHHDYLPRYHCYLSVHHLRGSWMPMRWCVKARCGMSVPEVGM